MSHIGTVAIFFFMLAAFILSGFLTKLILFLLCLIILFIEYQERSKNNLKTKIRDKENSIQVKFVHHLDRDQKEFDDLVEYMLLMGYELNKCDTFSSWGVRHKNKITSPDITLLTFSKIKNKN